MNREQLLETLLVERYAPRPTAPWLSLYPPSVGEIRTRHNDDDITTYARRKELDEACEGFDIPRFAHKLLSTETDDVSAGQETSDGAPSTLLA